jgi:hypothetical protein
MSATARIDAVRTRLIIQALALALACGLAACAPVAGRIRFDIPPDCQIDPNGPVSIPVAPTRQQLECVLSGIREVIIPTPEQDLLAARAAGELAAGDSDVNRIEKLASEGQWFAERALFHHQNDPTALYWMSVNLGQLMIRHPIKALRNLSKMESALKKAAKAVPDVDEGGPLRVLGMLYVKAPSWPQGIGDSDKGIDLLRKAVQIHPEHPLNHFFLARAMWDVDGDSVKDEVAASLSAASTALAAREWGWASRRWERDLAALMREAKLP